ncbi:carbonic anhydrase [Parvularcula lutaonensis]|uniref:Carbonic anhydrase n=1 Tax=Parvularcula lutaonensis TaxID=491923 RepID=A0ABV7MEC3_9PROT|nr:carbonic anhydrase [Parvularcula lutaonensis]GGY50207.1 carbonic anhydrase [Parvularcula lutaonensis]
MPTIAAGVVKFQKETFPKHKDLFEKLATGQEPEALFITCSDSRIDPSMMTSTEPGQLFICRNAGNIVPPHTTATGAMTASIEFAVGALKVPHIVVCGHTECGAMKGAMNLDALSSLPHTKEWLSFSAAAVAVVNEKGANMPDPEKMHLLIQENVLLQLQHLRTHPTVAAALAAGRVKLHGWVYDIKTGAVEAYDEDKNAFTPVEERYAAEVAAFAERNTHGH